MALTTSGKTMENATNKAQLQGGAPKIAKLVYKWLNNGLW